MRPTSDDRTLTQTDDDSSVRVRDIHGQGITAPVTPSDTRSEDGEVNPWDSVPRLEGHKNLRRGVPKNARSPERKAQIQAILDKYRLRSAEDTRPKKPPKQKTPKQVEQERALHARHAARAEEKRKKTDALLVSRIKGAEFPDEAITTLTNIPSPASGVVDEIDVYIKGLLRPKIKRLLNKAVELANGVLAEKKVGNNRVIYAVPPNEKMLNYLLDQYLGRSKARKENVGAEANEMKVTVRHL